MTLSELRAALAQAGVHLGCTEAGRLRYDAPGPLPVALVESMKAHRAALLRQVEQGRTADGRLNVAALAAQRGHCGCCARWNGPDAYGDGLCSLGRAAHGWLDGNPRAPVLTVAHHACAAQAGKGWKARTHGGNDRA
ncbi:MULTISPECIES: hypothetical protein [unclassified Deinococcus]|uniref:hypothetical protein n=1 Tax=unclassified Deinococcus TaxID=2623546 RepID=UPI001C311338|nr:MULTISPECIES: hypothetical protein [unclassified Deinococcus]MDK2014516.1 hypothetical protein [Deinococcus sp. 43]